MLNVALTLVPAGDDDGQSVFSAQSVASSAYLVIAALVGMVVLVVGEADRIENQVIMDVILINVSGEDKFIFAAQDLPCQLHADPVGFLWRKPPQAQKLGLGGGPGACPCQWYGGVSIQIQCRRSRRRIRRRTPAVSRPSCRDCRYSQWPLSALT